MDDGKIPLKKPLSTSKESILKILSAPKLELTGLEKYFKEEELPPLDPTPIGRHRLIQSFRNKFGEGYRNRAGVMKILKDFDEQRDFIMKVLKARE